MKIEQNPHKKWKWVWISFSLVFFIFISLTVISINRTLLEPGSDPVSARLAEWGRDHGLGPVVTELENLQYKFNKPKLGGKVEIKILPKPKIKLIGLQPDILTIANPPLPGEGVYQTAVKKGKEPIIQFAQLRPDLIHTSYLATVVWMSGIKTRFELRPGFSEPGRLERFKVTDLVSNREKNLLATFNSGFKINSSQGGFYLGSVVVKPLLKGSATLVTYQDGHSDIGIWGRDFKMSHDIVSARQNLKLLIDNGAISSNIQTAVQSNWGATLGSKDFVWRSGIGVTLEGDFVFVCGPALSAQSLADLLLHAGAFRAMQLDINPQWISYMWYVKSSGGVKRPIKAALFDRKADRYFEPSSRDFYAVYTRQ